MITYQEALVKMLAGIETMPVEMLPLKDLLGSVLAQPVVARLDSPLFDNSAVDGYGVRLADVAAASEENPMRLRLSGTIRAGDNGDFGLVPQSAIKILTGACVPASVEAVVMQEYCTAKGNSVLVSKPVSAGENIRRRGGEFLRGQEVAASGMLAIPPVVGLLANLGYSSFPAYRKPRAAVVTTGNELVKPGQRLAPGKIYDSNSFAMLSALRAFGINDCLHLHAAEEKRSTKRALLRALAYADVIISTGGVSVGEFDFVKEVWEELKVKTEIWRIAIKPGKPVYFGVYFDAIRRRHKYVFGLPGNPVSALVTYQLFVKPCLAKLMGCADFAERLRLPATLTGALRKKPGRMEFVRGVLRNVGGKLSVEPVSGQDSHMLGGLAMANALIHFPLAAESLEAGAEVTVELLDWNL